MGKKKDKKNRGGTGDEFFDYRYGVGEAKHLMKRYDVEGAASYHPDGRSMGKVGMRSDKDVKKDIASKMMNDYDTRRTMEAAAMAGNKDAKKFAKNGIKGKNIQDAYGVMRDLKKEYVGGGGMDGAENRASLTYAMVKEDRRVHNEDIDNRIAANTPELPEEDPDTGFTDPGKTEVSGELSQAKERAANFEAGMSAYGKGDDEQDAAAVTPDMTSEPGKAASMLAGFKEKLKRERNFKHSF